MSSVLEISGLSKNYGKNRGIENVGFTLHAGEVLALLGHNGAGKTTTIKSILGLLPDMSGQIKLFGDSCIPGDIEFDRARRRIGVVLDTPGFYLELSAMDNLKLFAGLYELPSDEFEGRAGTLLRAMDLYAFRLDKVKTFSRGMQQKLALLRALQHNPQLLIMDEPMTGLDPITRVRMRGSLRELADKQGVGIIFSSHDLNEAERISDTVVLLERGEIRLSGKLQDVKAQYTRNRYSAVADRQLPGDVREKLCRLLPSGAMTYADNTVSMAMESPLMLEQAYRAFKQLGIPLLEFRRETITLEEIYLTLLHENTN